jgi:glycosyltransferase involved in cell wall biosynthesis
LTEEDIICHWDSDDWSHPRRVEEQVALLQSSGAECVGYNEMLFWADHAVVPFCAEAWLYRSAIRDNYALGTSMCYWSDSWRRGNAFADRNEGCDDLYWSTGNRVKIESVRTFVCAPDGGARNEPRMVASIHGGNTCARLDAGKKEWSRVPEWDAYCRERMKL